MEVVALGCRVSLQEADHLSWTGNSLLRCFAVASVMDSFLEEILSEEAPQMRLAIALTTSSLVIKTCCLSS